MERYICKECGRYCYTSATSLAVHTTKDKCPYEGCQGRCIPAPWSKDNNAPFKLTFDGREYDIVDETNTHFIAAPVYRNEGYCYISKEAVGHGI